MLTETVLTLAEDARIVAVKEASGSLDQACEILRGRPAGFAVLSGEDSLALPMVACGADGVIAVVSNEAPALLVEASPRRSRASATPPELQARLFPLMRANFRESNPIPVKWALPRLGLVRRRPAPAARPALARAPRRGRGGARPPASSTRPGSRSSRGGAA